MVEVASVLADGDGKKWGLAPRLGAGRGAGGRRGLGAGRARGGERWVPGALAVVRRAALKRFTWMERGAKCVELLRSCGNVRDRDLTV